MGAAVVVAAGNDTANAANYSPAGCFGVFTIGATGPTGDRASYSNYSTVDLDLSAPGGDMQAFGPAAGIVSTLATGTQSNPGVRHLLVLPGHQPSRSARFRHHFADACCESAIDDSPDPRHFGGYGPAIRRRDRCAQTGICGAGILDAGTAVADAAQFVGLKWNYSDHWYYPPESGWGIQVTSQGDLQFVTWYTYGPDGSPRWFIMVLSRVGQDIFTGDIYATTGVPLPAINGQQSEITETKVGSATLFFYGYYDGALVYTLNGATTVKPIQRLQFGSPLTLCTYTTTSRATDTNYQDMWWTPTELGWGINLTHQGSVIFATWFTYDNAGLPIWFYMIANQIGSGQFSGPFYSATGVPFNLINGSPALLQSAAIGSGALTFIDGEHARFDYTVLGVSGSKMIEREVFSSPVTTCQPLQ